MLLDTDDDALIDALLTAVAVEQDLTAMVEQQASVVLKRLAIWIADLAGRDVDDTKREQTKQTEQRDLAWRDAARLVVFGGMRCRLAHRVM